MNELKLKNRVGLFLIIAQFALVCLIFVLYLFGGYDFSELTDTIALMFPMLSVYTAGMLKFFISNRNVLPTTSQPRIVTGSFVFLTWFFTGLFIFLLFTIIILKPLHFFDFEQFKALLAIIETCFAGFTGAVISALLDG